MKYVVFLAALALFAVSVTEDTSASDLPRLKPGAQARIGAIGEPGRPVELQDHLAAGKTTVFDFYSRRCPPCRKLAPQLARLAEARPDLAIRTIDIDRPGARGIDFGSPVARQHDISALPHFVIFDAGGQRDVSGDAAHGRVMGWIDELSEEQAPEADSAGSGSQRRPPEPERPAGSGGYQYDAGS